MNWISLYNINLFPFGTKQSHCPFSKLYNEKKDIILFSSRIHNINFILTCYLKVINGEVYDFRCYFCKSLPRVGSANRSELYRWEEFYVCFHNHVSLGKPIKNYRKKLHTLCEVRGGVSKICCVNLTTRGSWGLLEWKRTFFGHLDLFCQKTSEISVRLGEGVGGHGIFQNFTQKSVNFHVNFLGSF